MRDAARVPSTARPAIRVDPAREERELRDYLGEAYDHTRLQAWQEQLESEARRIGDEQALYRTSEAYLYNLTAFAMTQTKAPYLAALTRAVAPPARVLDYGCGIGSDGLTLAEAGYRVTFADFDNPSVRYLRWRLERRGLHADVYDLDHDTVPMGFDLAYAFDVLEHVDDPFAFLAELERRADRVLVNLLRSDPREAALHRALPMRALLCHAVGRGLAGYERHHDGRSQLVLYRGAGPRRGAARAQLRGAARVARGRLGRGNR